MRYIARDGRVYVQRNGKLEERTTALTSNGRDLARFDSALQAAQRQRREYEGPLRVEKATRERVV